MEDKTSRFDCGSMGNSAYIAVECVYAPAKGGCSMQPSRRPEPARPVEPTCPGNPSPIQPGKSL
jgi:hypothetical protein